MRGISIKILVTLVIIGFLFLLTGGILLGIRPLLLSLGFCPDWLIAILMITSAYMILIFLPILLAKLV